MIAFCAILANMMMAFEPSSQRPVRGTDATLSTNKSEHQFSAFPDAFFCPCQVFQLFRIGFPGCGIFRLLPARLEAVQQSDFRAVFLLVFGTFPEIFEQVSETTRSELSVYSNRRLKGRGVCILAPFLTYVEDAVGSLLDF